MVDSARMTTDRPGQAVCHLELACGRFAGPDPRYVRCRNSSVRTARDDFRCRCSSSFSIVSALRTVRPPEQASRLAPGEYVIRGQPDIASEYR